MPHNFLSPSVASEEPTTAKSNHTSPTPLSDPPDASQPIHHLEKLNKAVLPETTRFPYSVLQPKLYVDAASQSDSSSRLEQGSVASLSPSSDDVVSVAPSPLEPPIRDNSFQSSPVEAVKRRPLPSPPSSLSRLSDPIPSSPPPPYSRFLSQTDLMPTTRDLSRMPLSPAAHHHTPGPEAPVILPPPPNEEGHHDRPTYDTFLCHSIPANTRITVETSQLEYSLLVQLPGFQRDGMLVPLVL